MATVGKNILDNLTTGMYSDSKVIYREYIQNACDQIDKAISDGILSADEGLVDIYIDEQKRYISIKDNATGVLSADFRENLGDIANSNKKIGQDKGFRGIGRLCGLAYCKTLKFTTSAVGEETASVMICDAKKMRAMLVENKKYTLDDIWDSIVKFDSQPALSEEHFFEVELIDINKENTALLDEGKVKDYLSFVAPVAYKNTFIFRSQIYEHAKNINYHIDEYCIKINGEQLVKNYTTRLKEPSGNKVKDYDEISTLEFKDFYDYNGKLLAWMWVGLSRFEKQIPKINFMRGLRIRTANIQLGNDDALSGLFKESRGNYYFVGEVFSIDKQLIPNSQRNYFNENEARIQFEDALREYFYDVLHKLYTFGNQIKNAYKSKEAYNAKVEDYDNKQKTNGFINEEDRQKFLNEIDTAKRNADKADKVLSKLENNTIIPLAKVGKNIAKKYDVSSADSENETSIALPLLEEKKKPYITANMSKLTRNERKLVSRILSIITDMAPKDIAEQIIEKIKEEMS
jgi:molecular chaperone HtpG